MIDRVAAFIYGLVSYSIFFGTFLYDPGWLPAFRATPTMTAAHLFFAAATTLYILAAIRLEEGDLVRLHGDEYRDYRQSVPMLLPLRFGGKAAAAQAAGRRAESA